MLSCAVPEHQGNISGLYSGQPGAAARPCFAIQPRHHVHRHVQSHLAAGSPRPGPSSAPTSDGWQLTVTRRGPYATTRRRVATNSTSAMTTCVPLAAAASPSTRSRTGATTSARASQVSYCRGSRGGAPGAATTVCHAYGRGGASSSSASASSSSDSDDYYAMLGVEPDCEEEDIRAAFRRRAKELHPDINKQDDATAAFVALSRAYQVLSDPAARRQYDSSHRGRRFSFFRDSVEDQDPDISPFRWSQVGVRQPGGGGGGGFRSPPPFDDSDPDLGAEEEGGPDPNLEDRRCCDGDDCLEGDGGCAVGGGGSCEEEGRRRGPRRSPEDFLEELARVMSGGPLQRGWGGRQADPWGTSTSDQWLKQVDRQMRDPYGPARPGYGRPASRDDDEEYGMEGDGMGGAGEWGAPGRRSGGWSPPGRGSEWSNPRRLWDEEDRRAGGGGAAGAGGPGKQGGGGGDFRRPFKI